MRTNIYIRKENEDKWNAIPDKSKWINTLLSNSDDTSRYGTVKETPAGPMVEVLSADLPPASKAGKEPLNTETKDYSLCKHNQVKGFCKHGCR